MRRRITVVEIDFVRRRTRVSRLEKRTNEEVTKRLDARDSNWIEKDCKVV